MPRCGAAASSIISNRWSIPEDLMNCGLAYLVERRAGHDARPYAEVIIKQWGDGSSSPTAQGSHFGYHALAYDWIYDALTPEQRVRFGDALGSWLRYFTDKPEILLKWGHWEYNQTWGPIHLNIDELPRCAHAEAVHRPGHQRRGHEIRGGRQDLPRLLEPARAGGVHPGLQSHGRRLVGILRPRRLWPGHRHSLRLPGLAHRDGHRPVQAAEALGLSGGIAALGGLHDDAAQRPHRLDRRRRRLPPCRVRPGGADAPRRALAMVLRPRAGRGCASAGSAWRATILRIPATPPDELPLGYLFPGAGHVYMRSAWNDPNATWAFFGCGPQFAGHARDDEGHFLICKRGSLVSRQGGQGHNDTDYYAGGSLIFNIVTIFDPEREVPPGQGQRERRRPAAARL